MQWFIEVKGQEKTIINPIHIKTVCRKTRRASSPFGNTLGAWHLALDPFSYV